MLILLVLNGVCFLQQQFRQNSYREIKEETSIRLQLMREVRNLDAAETEKYLSGILNGDYSETYKNSCLELLAQMEHITTYDEYIEQVIEESGRVSRFSVFATDSSDFSTQNAANVVSEYEGLEGVKLLPGNDKPVVQFMDYQLMIYLSVVMTIVIAFMVIREHDAGITQLIYSSARGRLPLGFKRCGFISLAAFVCTALNMLTVWLLSIYLYGGRYRKRKEYTIDRDVCGCDRAGIHSRLSVAILSACGTFCCCNWSFCVDGYEPNSQYHPFTSNCDFVLYL